MRPREYMGVLIEGRTPLYLAPKFIEGFRPDDTIRGQELDLVALAVCIHIYPLSL